MVRQQFKNHSDLIGNPILAIDYTDFGTALAFEDGFALFVKSGDDVLLEMDYLYHVGMFSFANSEEKEEYQGMVNQREDKKKARAIENELLARNSYW